MEKLCSTSSIFNKEIVAEIDYTEANLWFIYNSEEIEKERQAYKGRIQFIVTN